jgi:sugar fermentation stimulation protein A
MKNPVLKDGAVSPSARIKLFTNDREALFVRRPNRFLIIAEDGANGEKLACHCPNPGRLIEFFGPRGNDIPGIRLILEKRSGDGGAGVPKAKTAWTAAGIYYRDAVAPLFSSRANRAAEKLILKRIIPGLRELRPEYAIGSSRFDFLGIDGAGKRHLIEVKACSLIEYGVAMFPDAPSGRALKHLEELAALTAEGYACHVLFVIVHGNPEKFVPNLHTDPDFAVALSRYGAAAGPPDPEFAVALSRYGAAAGPPDPEFAGRPDHAGEATAEKVPGFAARVSVHAALLRCSRRGNAVLAAEWIPVDLSHGELAASNRGNYLILLELPETAPVELGSLGTITFASGWYVYAGSAQKNLSQRVGRHLRKVRKQKHWHIDYLTPFAKTIKALPIMAYRNLECLLAGRLGELGGRAIPRFGSSDCRCESHLYYFPDPPMKNRAFVDMLLRARHIEGLVR